MCQSLASKPFSFTNLPQNFTMFLLGKKWKTYKWVAISIIALFIVGNLYALFFKPNTNSLIPVLLLGLLLGGILMFFIGKATKSNNNTTITESTHTIVESMRKVFKVVCAEGQFNELYDYEETKKYLSFIPSTKKALVIIKAKVLIGYDFEKCVWETDEENKKISLVSFPKPEILSIEPDYNYYNMENGIFNKFDKEDVMTIQAKGKKQIEIAAHKSDLPKIAAEQMQTLLTEVLQSNKWQLENRYKIIENA